MAKPSLRLSWICLIEIVASLATTTDLTNLPAITPSPHLKRVATGSAVSCPFNEWCWLSRSGTWACTRVIGTETISPGMGCAGNTALQYPSKTLLCGVPYTICGTATLYSDINDVSPRIGYNCDSEHAYRTLYANTVPQISSTLQTPTLTAFSTMVFSSATSLSTTEPAYHNNHPENGLTRLEIGGIMACILVLVLALMVLCSFRRDIRDRWRLRSRNRPPPPAYDFDYNTEGVASDRRGVYHMGNSDTVIR